MGNRAVYRQDVNLRVGKIEQVYATNQLPDNKIAYTIRLVVDEKVIREHWLEAKNLRHAFDLGNVLKDSAVAMDRVMIKTDLNEVVMIELFKQLLDKIKRMSHPDWTLEEEIEIQNAINEIGGAK